MTARILALNPGSSSLKAAVRADVVELSVAVDGLDRDEGGSAHVDGAAAPFRGGLVDALDVITGALATRGLAPHAVAHRIVHGGPHHYQPTVIDSAVLDDLRAAIPLAPLHLPGALHLVDLARDRWPDAVHVACFDTGFHHDLPETSTRLPVPAQLADLSVRRYGFHGLSIQSVLQERPDCGNVVIAHLGSGCSVTAVGADGQPRHTTMSMTPTGGMISATRTGDLDPEILLYLIEQHGYQPAELRDIVNFQSGVAGFAGGRHDFRALAAADDDAARFALDMFVRSAAMAIAASATALDTWDALIFTGGLGEHDESIREQILARVRPAPSVTTTVIPAQEELMLDSLTRQLLAGRSSFIGRR
jgi:acetate kinase